MHSILSSNSSIDKGDGFSVNTDIADRPKSIENVKRIQEHIRKGPRKVLIVMATGTEKTRVAMVIIDSLIQERRGLKVSP